MGRTDDVINVAGHRLSTGSMEAVLAAHPAVAECAVIGAADALKGQVPRGFVVLKAGHEVDEAELAAELIAAVRDEIGPVAAFKDVRVVTALPKTRSGKILRKTMRQIADGEDTGRPGHDRGRRRSSTPSPRPCEPTAGADLTAPAGPVKCQPLLSALRALLRWAT